MTEQARSTHAGTTSSLITEKLHQVHPPEARGQRHVGGVAAGAHQDAADARHVVARIERVPLAGQIDLEPAGEIHRRGIAGHADVAEIAGAIARRDVHAAAERQRQMRKIAADAGALLVDVMRRLHVMGVLVAEGDVVMDEIDDRLHPRPARRRVAEQRPGDIGELVGLAIAARHQIEQHLVGQLVDRHLLRGRHHDVGQAGIAHQRVAAQASRRRRARPAGRRHCQSCRDRSRSARRARP